MSTVFASDLDRTLIHPTKTLPRELFEQAKVVEYYQSKGITVSSAAVLERLRRLADAGAFVPVTTRSRAQLERISAIWELAATGWAVCANGATILKQGEIDPEWQEVLAANLLDCAPLDEAQALFGAGVGNQFTRHWISRIRDCDNRFFYAIVELDHMPGEVPASAHQVLSELNWRVVLHGRKLYVLPQPLCKAKAVKWLRAKLGVERLVTAGDSLLDVELLELGDESWCPRDAELVALGATPNNARLTAGSHLLAADEISAAAFESCCTLRPPGPVAGPSMHHG